MNKIIDDKVKDFIRKLDKSERSKISRYFDLLEQYGFALTSQYLKKLDSDIWELRPGDIRILFGWSGDKSTIVIVHAFKKKSQKTPLTDLERAKGRLKQY